MNFIEKQIVKKIVKVTENVENIEQENIKMMQEKSMPLFKNIISG
jgi:hypothetical protein